MTLDLLQYALLLPVLGGSIFSVLCVWAGLRFFARAKVANTYQPPITVLKPIYGFDKGLEDNLLSLIRQDYPDLQVVLSVQRADDPALPLLRRLAAEYPARVTLLVKPSEPVVNGKVQNLVNALTAAKHEILLISDSDARLQPGYLTAMVAPLADNGVGYVCSLYRSMGATHWFEKLEMLTLNADFVPSLIFSHITGASDFCIGATVAFRKTDLERTGGMAALSNYLVEDYELGRRLLKLGKRMVLIPNSIEIVADYPTFARWWHHQVYWDQNTWAANPIGFSLTVLTRAIPFALAFAALRGFDTVGLNTFLAAVLVRVATARMTSSMIGDRESVGALWLLPFRDVVALGSWWLALTRRSFEWRGHRFGLTRDGQIVPRGEALPIAIDDSPAVTSS